MSFSFSKIAPGTRFNLYFSEVKAAGRKLELASSVGNIIFASLKAFTTNSEQKNARPRSTN